MARFHFTKGNGSALHEQQAGSLTRRYEMLFSLLNKDDTTVILTGQLVATRSLALP